MQGRWSSTRARTTPRTARRARSAWPCRSRAARPSPRTWRRRVDRTAPEVMRPACRERLSKRQPESNQRRIRVQAESNQSRIRVESESNQTHRSCHAPPKQRREIPRAHRDAPYKDVGRAHLWGSKAAVVSVCMQGRWSPRRSTPAARAPPTHPHTTARAMQERAARPPRTCGKRREGAVVSLCMHSTQEKAARPPRTSGVVLLLSSSGRSRGSCAVS